MLPHRAHARTPAPARITIDDEPETRTIAVPFPPGRGDRPGGDGDRVQGAGREAGAARGAENAAARRDGRSGAAEAVPEGGAGDRGPESPEHRDHPLRGGVRGDP